MPFGARIKDADGATWQRPLRSFLGLAMVVLLVAVSCLLVGLDYRRARNAAVEGAKVSMRVFADRLVDRLGVLSGDTITLVGVAAAAANSLVVPPPGRLNDKIAVLREGMSHSPHIDGAYVGYPDGSFFHVVNLQAAGWRSALHAPAEAKMAVRTIELDPSGARLNHVIFLDAEGRKMSEGATEPAKYDPRVRPWYTAAIGSDGPVSIGPYEMATTGALGMTIAQSHRSDRKIVIGVDVVLHTILEFLAAERMSKDTVAFIIDPSGNLVIHSDQNVMRRILSPGDTTEERTMVADTRFKNVVADNSWSGEARHVDVDGRTYLVTVIPIDSELLFARHRLVVAAPLDELMAAANGALMEGLGVSAVVITLAVLCALLLARLITKSLHLLTEGATRLQNLDFTTPVELASHVSEISTLGRAMNKARNAIYTFALYVPKEIVRSGIQSGEFSGRTAWRQEVTALFTDIYDFTTISERLAPEDVVAMLSEYFDIFSVTVDEHHGTIVQFLGDSVFAMWNAPVADNYHAEHACRCALKIEERIRLYNEKQIANGLPDFRTRYGIHTGTAVVGSVGAKDRLQYTAMGDTVNVASRLEGMNKTYGTSILASADVAKLCGDQIVFRKLGSAQVKGRFKVLEIYEVVGETPKPARAEGSTDQKSRQRQTG